MRFGDIIADPAVLGSALRTNSMQHFIGAGTAVKDTGFVEVVIVHRLDKDDLPDRRVGEREVIGDVVENADQLAVLEDRLIGRHVTLAPDIPGKAEQKTVSLQEARVLDEAVEIELAGSFEMPLKVLTKKLVRVFAPPFVVTPSRGRHLDQPQTIIKQGRREKILSDECDAAPQGTPALVLEKHVVKCRTSGRSGFIQTPLPAADRALINMQQIGKLALGQPQAPAKFSDHMGFYRPALQRFERLVFKKACSYRRSSRGSFAARRQMQDLQRIKPVSERNAIWLDRPCR